MTILRIFTILSLLVFAGCATNPMQVSSYQILQKPQSSEAQVVFLRSSFMGSAINASLYDVTGGELKFVGIIANGTKIAYDTKPGKHTFMVVSEAADFMEADIRPGKTYYSIVTPRMGAWKARFSLWPIKNDASSKYNLESPDFDSWLSGTKLVEHCKSLGFKDTELFLPSGVKDWNDALTRSIDDEPMTEPTPINTNQTPTQEPREAPTTPKPK